MWKIFLCSVLFSFFLNVSSLADQNRLVIEGSSKSIRCNDTMNKSSSYFHLSNFTAASTCFFYINVSKVNETKGISLFLKNLILQKDDALTIYKSQEDALNGTNALFDPIKVQNGSITIDTEEEYLAIKIEGPDRSYIRKFEAYYKATGCKFTLDHDITVLNSPITSKEVSNKTQVECIYTYNKDPHHRVVPSLTLEQYNFMNFPISVTDGTFNDKVDYIPKNNETASIEFTVKFDIPTNETFRLRMHMVDSVCSHFIPLTSDKYTLQSPDFELNNGTVINECRWIFEHQDSNQKFNVHFEEIHLDSVLDIFSVNDGGSELSTPLLQVTASTQNTSNQIIRSSSNHMWIAFKPISYRSKIIAVITFQDKGGHFNNNGSISLKNEKSETDFLLEVEDNHLVFLNFTSTDFKTGATLNVYNGFDKTDLLTTVRQKIWYPILSKSSKLLITATGFDKSEFAASFKGVLPGCMQMSSLTNQDYTLSGNCNASCMWIIPPQDSKQSVLLLHLQFLALQTNDTVEIIKLDAAKSLIGSVAPDTNHVPQISIPANIGAMVVAKRGICKKAEDVILVGHTSYVPACGKVLAFENNTDFQVSSPLYPDTYPVLAKCLWNITTRKENIIHLSFRTMKLSQNHCIKVSSSMVNVTMGPTDVLPDDVFLTGGSAVLEFDSINCGAPKVQNSLESSEGFLLNGQVTDCGGVLSGKSSGEFNVLKNKPLCIWKVSVPGGTVTGSVNIVSFSFSKKDDIGNYELVVYDGASIRETAITNQSSSEIWGKTNSLIFMYKRIDPAKPSSILSVKYNSIGCDKSMQCENKMCLHPDWLCNGVNDCGDFTDERNCASIPIPDKKEILGYSAATYWSTLFIMLAFGIVVGIAIPVIKEKIANRRYARFGDISDIS